MGETDQSSVAERGREESLSVGVVLRREPGVTRWAKWRWSVAAVLPGAGPAQGRVLAEDAQSGLSEFHAATVPLELHRAEVEGYRVSLSMSPPSVFVVLRPADDPDSGDAPHVHLVTASAYQAQDYTDGDEEIVEPVPAPAALTQWIAEFVEAHWRDEEFKKRRRDRYAPQDQNGKGDARVRQIADVYRAPGDLKPQREPGDDE